MSSAGAQVPAEIARLPGLRVHPGLWRRRCVQVWGELVASPDEEDRDRRVQMATYAGAVYQQAQRGRVRPASWSICGSLRCTPHDPLLHSITKRRTARGRSIRDAVVPAEGQVLVVLDIRSSHYWIVAGLTGDEVLLGDLEAGLLYDRAAEILGVTREQAKVALLALVNGGGKPALSRALGIRPEDAPAAKRKLAERWTGLARMPLERAWTTPLGRRVTMPDDSLPHSVVGWRLQSIEADAVLTALTALEHLQVVHQVHDELLIEAPADLAPAVLDEARTALDRAVRAAAELAAGSPESTVKARALPSWSGAEPELEVDDPGGELELPAGPVPPGGPWSPVEALRRVIDTEDPREGAPDLFRSPWLPRFAAHPAELAELRAVRGLAKVVDKLEAASRGAAKEEERAAREQRAEGRMPKPREDRAPDKPLIVKVPGGAVYYVRGEDEFVAVDSALLRSDLERLHPELDTWIEDEDGNRRPMRPAELYERWGRRADQLVYDMTERCSFDPGPNAGGVLMLRCCQLDPNLRPEFNHHVDEWLQRLGGDRYERLLDWLACSTRLDRPIAALYLEGEPSSGKGFIVSGLGNMYVGRGACSFADIVGSSFNSKLKFTPVVHVDEQAPPIPNGSAGFRNLVSESERDLTEKFRPTAIIRGCVRLVITANGPSALGFEGENLNRAAEEAIALRIVHILINSAAAAEYLSTLGGREGTHRWVRDGDDRPGALPNHIAWLTENWKVQTPGGRLLVQGDSADWFKGAATRGGLSRTLLHVIAWAASGRDLKIAVADRPVFYRLGEAWINVERLLAAWGAVAVDQSKLPTATAVGNALGNITIDKKAVMRTVPECNRRLWVHRVPADLVLDAARRGGIGDVDAVRTRLGVLGTPADEEAA